MSKTGDDSIFGSGGGQLIVVYRFLQSRCTNSVNRVKKMKLSRGILRPAVRPATVERLKDLAARRVQC